MLRILTRFDEKIRKCLALMTSLTQVYADRKRNMQMRRVLSVISGQYRDRVDLRRVLTPRWTLYGSDAGRRYAKLRVSGSIQGQGLEK